MTDIDAPRIRVREMEFFERPYQFRMPFRYGPITTTEGRQAVARVRIELADGRSEWGVAAESIGKWFDKDPKLAVEDNRNQLRLALEIASAQYRAQGERSPFGHFAAAYRHQIEEGARHRLNPLTASYGPAMLDRCVIDALGKLLGLSFWDMMRRNLAGMQPADVAPDMEGFDFGRFLAGLQPLSSLHVRHTVGMADPITAADQTPETRINDGLPETLEEIVAFYGQRYFKLKVGSGIAEDVERLSQIARVLDRIPEPYFATLDGNEQYKNAEAAVELWQAIEAEPRLGRLRDSTLYIEQPISRDKALDEDVAALSARRAVIIDESDGEVDAFVRARAHGYAGVSTKNCKGFYKSLINRARCAKWNAEEGGNRYFMSAEDLTTSAGIAVQQDLALVALLGLTHVERNAHHFIRGMADRSPAEQQAFLQAHPDLYREADGTVHLKIVGGRVELGSLACPGFAVGAEIDWTRLEPMPKSTWR